MKKTESPKFTSKVLNELLIIRYCGARGRPRQGPAPGGASPRRGEAPPGAGPANPAGAAAPPGAGPENFAGAAAPPGAGPQNLSGAKAPPGAGRGPGLPGGPGKNSLEVHFL